MSAGSSRLRGASTGFPSATRHVSPSDCVVAAPGSRHALGNQSIHDSDWPWVQEVMKACRRMSDCRTDGQPGQRCFFVMVAVKSGSFFATQSTNLRTFGFSSRPATSIPWR